MDNPPVEQRSLIMTSSIENRINPPSLIGLLSVVLTGRNDMHGSDFSGRLFRTCTHNASLLQASGLPFEFVISEWNPLPDAPLLACEFVRRVPHSRAVIVPPSIHDRYNINPNMSFQEMAAKNVAIRRARGDFILVLNADILLDEALITRLVAGGFHNDVLYRAQRIDVNPNLTWEQMKDPANQLDSGEGQRCPCYYLGAAGDFCLASRELWYRLRGVNEYIRFSNRAKDWQFYLSAAALGIGIQFIGRAYHLDHGDGFQRTSREVREGSAVPFGEIWDIEFGFPVFNREDWGLAGLPEKAFNSNPSIVEIDATLYSISPERDLQDRLLRYWITWPASTPDLASATFFHAICLAHRRNSRLICRLTSPQAAVALSGMSIVAREFGISIFCNWEWPVLEGLKIKPFVPEPPNLEESDLLLDEEERRFTIVEPGTGHPINPLPERMPVRMPRFNPLMVRRLLRACLLLQKIEVRTIVIYGAGSHTEDILEWGLPDGIKAVAIATSQPQIQRNVLGLPLIEIGKLALNPPDAILLSSSAFEEDMFDVAHRAGFQNIIPLYRDWPVHDWNS
jgi:hypothetical protein